MRKVPVILEIKLAIEEPKDKIRVRKESHGQTRNRSPIPNSFIMNGPGNDRAGERMSDGVHKFMVT